MFFKGILIVLLMLVSACSSQRQSVTIQERFELNQEVLSAHNILRARHHAPNLVWDEQLEAYADKHANTCKFRHSHSPYGENLAAGYPSPTAAIDAWYAEKGKYNFNSPGFLHGTGHFTQLIWKSSHKVGCAYVVCNGKNGTPGKYLVCEYSPAGNVINKGFFKTNVLSD